MNVIADNQGIYEANTSETFVFGVVEEIGVNTLFQFERQSVMEVACR